MLKVDDVLEILSIPLLGIIPESQEVLARLEPRPAGHDQQRRERAGARLSATPRAGSRAKRWR